MKIDRCCCTCDRNIRKKDEEDLKYGDIVRVKDKNEEVVVIEEMDADSVSTMDMFGNTVPYRKDMVEKVK